MCFARHKTHYLLLIVILVYVVIERSVVHSACPVEAKTATFGNTKACYWKNTTRVDWMTALQSCRDWGGDLASIHSRDEDEFIADEIARHVADTNYAPYIGLVNLQGKFAHYSDGTPYDYNGWLPNHPNNNREQCGTVLFLKQHGWNDVGCSHKTTFICKIVLNMSCENYTCRNAGSCTVAWNGLPTCHCLPYYQGDKCETVKECPRNSQLDYFSGTCECVAGYEPADTHGMFCSPCAMNFSKSAPGNTKCSECPSTVGIGSTYCAEGSNPARPCTASGMSLGAALGIVGAVVAVNALCLLILVYGVCKKLKSRRQGQMLQWDESHVLRPAPPKYQPVQVARIMQADTSS